MPYYFYVLQSEIDHSYYRGQTEDLDYRVRKHNNAESKSTKSKRPWKLVYSEEFATRSEAVRREQFLKSPQGWREWLRIREKAEGEHESALVTK
jgi:putative endonuclease